MYEKFANFIKIINKDYRRYIGKFCNESEKRTYSVQVYISQRSGKYLNSQLYY